MKRVRILVALLALPALALAQQPRPGNQSPGTNSRNYFPAVPAPSMSAGYGGWGGWGGGGATVAGSYMNGMSNVISAKGNYNLATSAAAVNMTQAESNELQNRQQATDTYFEMRATNRAARKAEEGPNMTMEQITKIAHDYVPKPLDASKMDPVTGALIWPDVLQTDAFKPQRQVVDELFTRHVSYGGLSYTDQTKVRAAVNSMFAELKKMVKTIPPPYYIACKGFLNDVMFAATKTEL